MLDLSSIRLLTGFYHIYLLYIVNIYYKLSNVYRPSNILEMMMLYTEVLISLALSLRYYYYGILCSILGGLIIFNYIVTRIIFRIKCF